MKKTLTNGIHCTIILKMSRNAAIAQPVERILGKDEVASSNLASSSKTPDSYLESGVFFYSAVQPMLDLPFLNSGILQED